MFNIENISQIEIGYLVGLFLGDGYSYQDKTKCYHVEFFLNSRRDNDIKNYLLILLKKASLNPILLKDKRCNCIRIRVNSKDFYKFLRSYKNLLNNIDFKCGFISGLIDADGYVNFQKSFITIKNTKKQLLNLVKKSLKTMNINSTLSKKRKTNKNWSEIYELYISTKILNINNNSIKFNRIAR